MMNDSRAEGMSQVDVMSWCHFGVSFEELKRMKNLSCVNCTDYSICSNPGKDICECMEDKIVVDIEVLF